MSESLSPHERIRRKNDFSLIYKKGKRYRGKFFNLVYLPNGLDFSRMAAVASKKIGNAVKRNKAKRWMRTLFRRNKELLLDPHDLIIITKPEINGATWVNLNDDYLKAIKFINKKSQAA
jgi:ribonuclease P protein component